jgi:hypothetical protein
MANLIYSEAAVEFLAIHFIGNKNNNGELKISEQETDVQANAEQNFSRLFFISFQEQ